MNKIAVLILSSLISFSVAAADLPNFPFVVANGTAEKKIKPDTATVHLSIMAFEKESDQALKTVNLTTTQVSDIITKYGVRKENIEATDINKSTTRRRDPEFNALEILGYEVTRSMTIRLDNLAQYPEIMGNLIATNNVSGVRADFDISNRKAVEAELIAAAGAEAREKSQCDGRGPRQQDPVGLWHFAGFFVR
ncbi:MAG: SIMPL domain-containing protein [Cellvibrionaceae bacterium]|nr:SIMPL domain-containing protein [Cellvibrionaceae bacterium]